MSESSPSSPSSGCNPVPSPFLARRPLHLCAWGTHRQTVSGAVIGGLAPTGTRTLPRRALDRRSRSHAGCGGSHTLSGAAGGEGRGWGGRGGASLAPPPAPVPGVGIRVGDTVGPPRGRRGHPPTPGREGRSVERGSGGRRAPGEGRRCPGPSEGRWGCEGRRGRPGPHHVQPGGRQAARGVGRPQCWAQQPRGVGTRRAAAGLRLLLPQQHTVL